MATGTGFKAEMVAKLDIPATAFMKGPDKSFIESNAELKKTYRNFTFQEKVQLDSRKWNPSKLSEAMKGLVAYELKLLAVQVAQARKGHSKDTEKQQQAEAKQSTRSMMQIVKALNLVKADLAKKEKRLADITPDRKGKRKVEPKNPKEEKAFEKETKDLPGEIKKLEKQQKAILAERDDLEDDDRKAAKQQAAVARSNALPMAMMKVFKDLYSDMEKDIENKCSVAIEELASGGDDKKAAKKGKDAMDRLKNPEKLKKLFQKPRDATDTMFTALERVLKNNSEDDPKVDTAFKTANNVMKKIRASFDKSGGEVRNAIDYLLKTSQKNDMKASAVMGDFVGEISKNKKKLTDFSNAIQKFDRRILDWDNEVSSRKIDAKAVASNLKEVKGMSSLDSDADAASKFLTALHKKFEEAEKEAKSA
ncbi:MAG: hypothetical protein AAF557_18900 [Pseudomonadota bacterium]